MNFANLVRRFTALSGEDRRYYLRRFIDQKVHARAGFSQFGEDATIAWYLRVMGRNCQYYLDIGANHPVIHSNTYLFYRDGASGVMVEANPKIASHISRARPRDTVVNVGVVAEGSGFLELHIMDMDGLSTMSQERKDHIDSRGLGRRVRSLRVPVLGINQLLTENVSSRVIDFASIDIEGTEFEVLSAWDFDRWRPYLFCVETTVVDNQRFIKDTRFSDLMRLRGYRPIFETFANTIYIDESV